MIAFPVLFSCALPHALPHPCACHRDPAAPRPRREGDPSRERFRV